MPEHDLRLMGRMLADWVEGLPCDSRMERRARLLAYHRVGVNPYHLGMLLHHVAFDLAMQGRTPGISADILEPFISSRSRAWEQRVLLAGTVLQLLEERSVDVTTDAIAGARAREKAITLLQEAASATDLQGTDWAVGPDDYHFGSA
ncbi:hypothetical protein [Streptomyces sp. NPDC047315]|uniref:hypothetical protein n=1 Tax=Streptomyces sp. NPDC047315 TaxID=3155142 RepID=UPI0033CBDE8C